MGIFRKILQEKGTEHFACGPKRNKSQSNFVPENALISDVKIKQHTLFKFFIKLGLVGFLSIFMLVLIMILYAYIRLPDIYSMINQTRPASIVFVDKDGYELRSLNKLMGESVDMNKLPPYVWQSIISIEDKRFFKHGAIDFRGLSRSVMVNLVSHGYAQGGSSITQQLAKNLFLSRSKTITRKIQEMLIAFWLEKSFSKDKILNLYMNRVSLSRGMHGIDSASRDIFGVPATNLTLSESARLAAMLKAPTTYNPITNPEKSKERAKLVLEAMLKQKYITEKQFNLAVNELNQPILKRPDSNVHRYFIDYVYDNLISELGSLPDNDIIVWTTLDSQMQRKIDKTINKIISDNSDKNVSQSSVIAIENNGAIRAMVGGLDYQKSQFNRTIQASRQTGSTFKSLVYLTAFENGMTPEDEVNDFAFEINGYAPKNYGNHYYGKIKIREAFGRSVNSVPLQLSVEYGLSSVLKVASRMGVGKDLKYEFSTILGASEMTLMDLTKMYSIMANHGYDVKPYAIEEIITEDGKILYKHDIGASEKIYDETVDEKMITVLSDVVYAPYGTGKRAKADGVIGGKTGTSSENRDAWFIGFTDKLTMGVWVGNDSNEPMDNITGGTLPAEIFGLIMN